MYIVLTLQVEQSSKQCLNKPKDTIYFSKVCVFSRVHEILEIDIDLIVIDHIHCSCDYLINCILF